MENQQILNVIRNSKLTSDLRDEEIPAIVELIEVRHYNAGQEILKPGDDELIDFLLIVGSGEAEARSPSGGVLGKLLPGDLAGIIGFVGGDTSQISAIVVARTDCDILLLSRKRFEGFLNSNPLVAYYLMRGIVRVIHKIARNMEKQSDQLKSSFFNLG